jgi:hypothetical protein
MVLVLLVGVATVGPSLLRQLGFSLDLPWSRTLASSCPSAQVQLMVAPELAEVVTAVLKPVQGSRQPDGHCLQAVVSTEPSADTVRKAKALSVNQAPQLWIPDSTLWEREIDRWPLQPEGSFATSPLVVATSEATATRLGWRSSPPTWAQALNGRIPVALPDLQRNASSVLSVLGLWQTLGKKDAANRAVAATVLASTRPETPTPAGAADAAVLNDPAAPLLVTSELAVFATNRKNASSRMTAVYPQDGSPSLDYPIVRIAPHDQSVERSLAVDTVVATLQGALARDQIHQYGLRDAGGRSPGGAGLSALAVNPLDPPTSAETTVFLDRLQALTRPSQLTVVVDVSPSMRTLIGGELTRAQLAGEAAITAGALLSDKSRVGLWIFSRNLPDQPVGTHYQQVDPPQPLNHLEGRRTHREVLNEHLRTLSEHLGGNGTALYATALAAMQAATKEYDPAAANAVVLFTDGANDDPGGISLDQLTKRLQQLADPERPVRLIAIGFGPHTDLAVLRTLVTPSGGTAYQAATPDRLKAVLVDAMANRPPTG